MGTLADVYEQDFYAWLGQNAQLLRQGRFLELDVENLAEEIESMGRSEKRQLNHRLEVLITHLLKWLLQVQKRSNSWRYTIKEQRRRLLKLLAESPSLRPKLEEELPNTYTDAIWPTARETGLDETRFPEQCPFSLDQLLDQNFWPS